MLGARSAGVFAEGGDARADRDGACRIDAARRLGADCAIAVGGGSTTGLGKAIALDSGLPVIAVPTTYAGSEMTHDVRPHRGGREEDGQRSARAAAGRDLRPGAVARLAVRASRRELDQRHRPCRRRPVRARRQSGLRPDGRGRHPCRARPRCRACSRPARHRRARRRARRRVALRHGDGPSRRPAPQALPHARRQLQPAARRGAHGDPAARDGLQRAAAPAAMPRIAHALGSMPATATPRRRLFDLARATVRRLRSREIGMRADGPRPRGRSRGAEPVSESAPARADAIRALLQRAFDGARPG